MDRKAEITRSLPVAVERISLELQRLGNISFWAQIILGIISTVLLLIAAASLFGAQQKTQGIEFGIFCAFAGVIVLAIAIVLCFRYRKLGRQIQNPDPTKRPKKADTLQVIKTALVLNVGGMLMSILGAQTLAGLVLVKSLNISQGTLNLGGPTPNQFVTPVDLLIIQANTNTILAHFVGIVFSLWLLQRLAR
jgi:hypothetical protein